MHVSLSSTETVIQTPIKKITLLVLDKVNLKALRLGVGIVEIIRVEINKTHTKTDKVTSPSDNEKLNLLLKRSIPRGISIKYAPAGAGTP